MKITAITLSAIILTSTFSAFANDGDDWMETTHRDGIVTYVGQKNHKGIRPTRASMVLEASPEEVLEVIYGIDDYTNWVPKCVDAKKLKSELDSNIYFYQVFVAPFIKDRDLITRVETSESAGVKTVELISEPYKEKSSWDKVRIKHFRAEYTITDLGNGFTKVEMTNEIDMEGIPVFILNWANESQPFETFYRLREQILNS
jgi:ribosome-associated toxin RatA of RatAB toxin-antitoxin module